MFRALTNGGEWRIIIKRQNNNDIDNSLPLQSYVGNADGDTAVVTDFGDSYIARFFRLYPITYTSPFNFRMELIGVPSGKWHLQAPWATA